MDQQQVILLQQILNTSGRKIRTHSGIKMNDCLFQQELASYFGVFSPVNHQGLYQGWKRLSQRDIIVERTSKAEVTPVEQSEKMESCRENNGIKYSWKSHKDRNRHKNRIKTSGQAQLVHVSRPRQNNVQFFDKNRLFKAANKRPVIWHERWQSILF